MPRSVGLPTLAAIAFTGGAGVGVALLVDVVATKTYADLAGLVALIAAPAIFRRVRASIASVRRPDRDGRSLPT